MDNIKLNFDIDTLSSVIKGLRILREASKKIQGVTIDEGDLKITYDMDGWLTDISTKIFKLIIEDQKDVIKSVNEKQIEKAMSDLGYVEYHRDIFFDFHLENTRNEQWFEIPCGVCRSCDECNSMFEGYLSQYAIFERRIKIDKRIDISKVSEDLLFCALNMLEEDFKRENVAINVAVSKSTNELIIEYLDDDGEFFSDFADSDDEKMQN